MVCTRCTDFIMINCKNCIHWVDESLEQIQADVEAPPHIFMGCRILGYREGKYHLEHCRHFTVSNNLFTICNTCKITVPKVCVSLGECANCTDTDLFCVDSCLGEDSRKYCTHFIRLQTEGVHLIDQDQVFDIFPVLKMPGQAPPQASAGLSDGIPSPETVCKPKSRPRNKTKS
jgi:hypothetical protein